MRCILRKYTNPQDFWGFQRMRRQCAVADLGFVKGGSEHKERALCARFFYVGHTHSRSKKEEGSIEPWEPP